MRTLFLLCLMAACCGCQSSTLNAAGLSAAPSKDSIADSTTTFASLAAQRDIFLAKPDLADRMERLLELEQQALQLAEDEPLKLGSIGSAILDIYYGSQTGHYSMSRFYAHVESDDAEAVHDAELKQLQQAMLSEGAGTRESPFDVMTIYDAHAYAKTKDTSPVGAIYQSSDATPFGFLLVSRPEHGLLEQTYFDISHVLKDFKDQIDLSNGSDQEQTGNPWTFMRLLASRMDSAAQTAIGRYLASVQKYDDAIGWLQVASRSGNVLANSLLARIYWTQAQAAEDDSVRDELRERSLENYLHAIVLGSTDSMYTLANLYINDIYGEDNRAAAIPLLRQAGDLGHAESLLYLGHLHNTGREVEQSVEQATAYFEQAAALKNPQAILSYGRFLAGLHADPQATGADNDQVHTWLKDLADDDNAEAMIVLGNLHARGVGTRASNGRAVRWYKKAINLAPENSDIVNEVAWTLTVSDLAGLKRARYAKRIMDKLMSDEAMRARPEYLDTWAAAHAASGDFTQAITLQEEAIAQAAAQEREDVLDILKTHLEQFKAGATITEQAP
jgi:TPR repeat protein